MVRAAALASILFAVTSSIASAGALSKFDKKAPTQNYISAAKIFDIERCLLDIEGRLAPVAYKQPDRPDDVTLLWPGPNWSTAARVSLHRLSDDRTSVVAWLDWGSIRECAPPEK